MFNPRNLAIPSEPSDAATLRALFSPPAHLRKCMDRHDIAQGGGILRDMLTSGRSVQEAFALCTAKQTTAVACARLHGAARALLDLIDEAQQAGATVNCRDVPGLSSHLIDAMHLRGEARVAMLGLVPASQADVGLQMLSRVGEALAPWIARRAATTAQAAKSGDAGQAQQVTFAWPAEPMPVAIVSTPKTVATSEVMRDASGRISTTVITTESVRT